MSATKKRTADLLFVIQVVCTVIFGGGQLLKMTTATTGVSPSWFLFWEVFLILNLVLALRAHKNQPSRVTWQTLFSYALWTVMVTSNLAVIISKGSVSWNGNDVVCVVLAGGMITFVLWLANTNSLGLTDPVVRGWFAVAFKAVPQLVMAYNIAVNGGDGLAATTVVAGHITVLTRLGQLGFSIHEAGWDRNRKGSAISEIGNEISWMVTTTAWFLV